jgi:hypothetical protein
MSPRSRSPRTGRTESLGQTVVGLFPTRAQAEGAVSDLKDAGFTKDQIGVAMNDVEEQRRLAGDSGAEVAEGAATGAVSGGVVGGLIGLLGSLLVPGVGPIVVGGVLASTLTGAGIGAATGGIIGALVGIGVPESDAAHFDQGLRTGGTLVTVDAGGRTGEALGILERHGMDFGPSGVNRYGSVDRVGGATAAAGAAEAVHDPGLPGSPFGGTGLANLGIDAGDVASDSSTGSRGFSTGRERYTGRERRIRQDDAYAGPERRLVGV